MFIRKKNDNRVARLASRFIYHRLVTWVVCLSIICPRWFNAAPLHNNNWHSLRHSSRSRLDESNKTEKRQLRITHSKMLFSPYGNFKLIFYIFDNCAYRTLRGRMRQRQCVDRWANSYFTYICVTDLFCSRLF